MKLILLTGRATINKTRSLGEAFLFLMQSLLGSISIRQIIRQVFAIGFNSLTIVAVSAIFIGFVLGLQGYYTLTKFSAESAVGPMVALSVLRELGPVVTALLFAGRAGSALTSEIGLMKATEQLSSLTMMGVDPIRYVVSPRFWAGQISMPLLNLIFCAIAVLSGYWVCVDLLGVYSGTYWGNMQSSVLFLDDIFTGIVKSVVFGFAVTWVSIYQGYFCRADSEGIAKATTKTVVYSSLLVLGLDFLLTAMMFK
ncbi:lipid asymmetry maintenance ABC transporter permease subunit MlaE [Thiotrichales bacterium 19S9-12]|nr:lipid asymmetry maintenance ABC transporter permease subunit MlaE [Thiotrichales bacterium 19S9-11]MCF6811630.1 lipid asymmetry maintenance ABC transporter permease subunit MlaE [Thiotrichales bacterium 19S9-12]